MLLFESGHGEVASARRFSEDDDEKEDAPKSNPSEAPPAEALPDPEYVAMSMF